MSALGPQAGGRVVLLCTVRGCGLPLARAATSARCAAGHSFDRARSGYWNLLQPQDRRSAKPGDSAPIVAARRRLFDRGVAAPLVAALAAHLEGRDSAGSSALLDVGCGEGSILGALAGRLGCEAHGVDLSSAALRLAATSHPAATWVVANADRVLPYADGAFGAVLSITARRPGAELRRVLDGDGLLIVAVPAEDDLAELRASVLGEARALGGGPGVGEELAPWFEPRSDETVRHRFVADHAACSDLLLATYRGQRTSQLAAGARLDALELTSAQRLQTFQPRR